MSRRAPQAPPGAGDRGSGSVLVLSAVAGALVLAAAAAAAGQVGAAAARAGSVADAAALAGAASSALGGSGCGRAGQVARAAGGELLACAEVAGGRWPAGRGGRRSLPGPIDGPIDGPVVDVEVAVRPRGIAGGLGPVSARARAGPAR